MSKRIFAFGCSFTEYEWPTWADIILYKNQGVNYGATGSGFEQIVSSLVQCDIDYKLNSEDVVIIVFPNLLRWDCPFYPKMISHGNIMSSPWTKHINKLWSVDGIIYKNINLIYMLDTFLKAKGVKYRYSSIVDLFK